MTEDETRRAHDGPSMDDAMVLLTGGTSGIGRAGAELLAERGATVVVTGRDEGRGREVARTLTEETPGTVTFQRADFERLDAVFDLARTVREEFDRLDVLVNNAACSHKERRVTPDGYEATWQVNHLAPFLLTYELVPLLVASAPARVVTTASDVHRRADLDFDDLQLTAGYDSLDAYARSKFANVAFTVELASRLPDGVTANCVHPGFVPGSGLYRDSGLAIRTLMRAFSVLPVGTSVEEGGRRLEHLAASTEVADVTGAYFDGYEAVTPAPKTSDADVRERLWRVSADHCGVDPALPTERPAE